MVHDTRGSGKSYNSCKVVGCWNKGIGFVELIIWRTTGER